MCTLNFCREKSTHRATHQNNFQNLSPQKFRDNSGLKVIKKAQKHNGIQFNKVNIME